MKTICINNENLKGNLELLKNNGYNYIAKAYDKFLSGWGEAENMAHVQLIACRTREELSTILSDLRKDDTLIYVNWYYIKDYKSIYRATYNKSFTIRNDWTRAFRTQEEKDKYLEG